jgi:hypothetical protein
VDLLSHAALLSCSDPRDKVYAFLGHPLAYPFVSRGLIKPDYQKPSSQVYLELSIVLIQHTGLRVLTTVEQTQSTILDDIPSWVTRWDVSLVMNDILRVPNTAYSASAGLIASSSFFTENKLNVQGIILDRIQQSYKIYIGQSFGIFFENSMGGEQRRLKDVLEGLQMDSSPSIYSDRVNAFCSTLCIGASVFESNTSRRAITLAMVLESRGQALKKTYTQDDEDEAWIYFNEVRGTCSNRTLVVTERGLYGLAPLITKPSDVACLICGVDVPFILRPDGEAGHFKLLGESYIHGVMEGQAKTMLARNEVFEQRIVIC